jgi:hypothetical protein
MEIGHTKEFVNVAVINMAGAIETAVYFKSLVTMRDNVQVTGARGVPTC